MKKMTQTEIHNYIAARYKDDLEMMIKCHNWQIRNNFPGIEKMDDALLIKPAVKTEVKTETKPKKTR